MCVTFKDMELTGINVHIAYIETNQKSSVNRMCKVNKQGKA